MKHTCQLRVRTYENDSYGHVNNAVYLHYLEYARSEFLADNGFDYEQCVSEGYGTWIARVEIDYRRPARSGDQLTIETTALERGNSYGVLGQRILRGQELCAEARVKWVFVETASGRPSRLPAKYDIPALTPVPDA